MQILYVYILCMYVRMLYAYIFVHTPCSVLEIRMFVYDSHTILVGTLTLFQCQKALRNPSLLSSRKPKVAVHSQDYTSQAVHSLLEGG